MADRHLKVVIVSLENIFTVTSASGFIEETLRCSSSFLTNCPEGAIKYSLRELVDLVVQSRTASFQDTVLPFAINTDKANKQDDAPEKTHVSEVSKVSELKS